MTEPSTLTTGARHEQVDPNVTPRCCAAHPDWATLAQHLVDCFPTVPLTVVVRELRAGRQAVTDTGLDGQEALQLAELITRHQLRLIDGQVRDSGRTDPQRKARSTG